jgi:hypothetical protein
MPAKRKATKKAAPASKRVKSQFGRWIKTSAVKVRKLRGGGVEMDFRPPGYRAPKKKPAAKKRRR